MMQKYRVSEVAKDFGVQSKVVIGFLEGMCPPAKKSNTALEEKDRKSVV